MDTDSAEVVGSVCPLAEQPAKATKTTKNNTSTGLVKIWVTSWRLISMVMYFALLKMEDSVGIR